MRSRGHAPLAKIPARHSTPAHSVGTLTDSPHSLKTVRTTIPHLREEQPGSRSGMTDSEKLEDLKRQLKA